MRVMPLVVIFGPPAVGKMTVGFELTKLTGYRLFHNHMTVEPVLDIFEFGSSPYNRLVSEFRERIIEEAAGSELPGLVFTIVWGLELESDRDLMTRYVDLVERRGGRVSFVELYAGQGERLARNTTEFRLDRKRSKRDLEFSRGNLLALDEKFVMNTGGEPTIAEKVWAGRDFVRIDNTHLGAAETAAQAAQAFRIGSGVTFAPTRPTPA